VLKHHRPSGYIDRDCDGIEPPQIDRWQSDIGLLARRSRNAFVIAFLAIEAALASRAASAQNDRVGASQEALTRPCDQGNTCAQNWLRDSRGWAVAQSAPPASGQISPEEAVRRGSEASDRKDYATALQWYRTAADQGNGPGQFLLGRMYIKGLGVPKDPAQVVLWWQKAAKSGLAAAQDVLDDKGVQSELGRMYFEGEGGTKDDVQAIFWLRKAADQGNAAAQVNLGTMFADGRGVRRDYAQALALYHKAADQNYAFAQVKIGVMYFEGDGVAEDKSKAFAWYRKAADSGDAVGQLLVGMSYLEGDGVPKDMTLAREWLRKSAKQDNKTAKAKLAELGEVSHAPTSVSQAAYEYLRLHFAGNELVAYKITSYDGDVCHLRYSFPGSPDFNLKFDFNAADIQPERLRAVSAQEGNGWAGIIIYAASGKQFKAEGRAGGQLSPSPTSIKLLTVGKPDDLILRALVKLATECGARQLPF
jgi:TPR repeat protein